MARIVAQIRHRVSDGGVGERQMRKATFIVVVIREGREQDYYDFWVRGAKKNEAGEELNSDLVGFTESIEAKNINEAVALVRERHPKLRVDVEATQCLG